MDLQAKIVSFCIELKRTIVCWYAGLRLPLADDQRPGTKSFVYVTMPKLVSVDFKIKMQVEV